MLTQSEIRNLIIVVQTDENEYYAHAALTDLLMDIMDNHMDRHVYRYLRKATVGGMDADDIRQIFLIACSKAIEIADPHIGNPMLFILQKGKWAITDELRKGYRRNLRQFCYKCNSETRLNERGGEAVCPNCGAHGEPMVERIQINTNDDGTLLEWQEDETMSIEDAVSGELLIKEFRKRLTGRRADIFDLIYYDGYDRDSCGNYQKEIAEKLGIAPTNVNLRLRQIKKEWKEFIEEVGENA